MSGVTYGESALETCPRITQLGESPELDDEDIGQKSAMRVFKLPNFKITQLPNHLITGELKWQTCSN
ncbi:MAG: hypothetical protein DMG97_40220 [Acidobacteria bacterium]|nr:MAG: hypothetical protein DMG97_40220 [Acidobacteriota bacterium]PYV74535.1 MAG: hypothetical protein DMG96_19920 [Acidobacteriota bacterium]